MMIHPFTIFVTLRFDPHVESTEEESNYFAPKMKDMLAAAASASVGPVACCPYLDPAEVCFSCCCATRKKTHSHR